MKKITTSNNTSVFGRTMDNLFQKFGLVRSLFLRKKIEENTSLLEQLSEEKKNNRNLTSNLYYYKTTNKKLRETIKTYEKLFNEIGEKQMGIQKKVEPVEIIEEKNVCVIKRQNKKKTVKKVVGFKKGRPTGPVGPYDKSDKTLTPKEIEGHTRTYKSGKTIYIEPFTNYYWITDEKKVS